MNKGNKKPESSPVGDNNPDSQYYFVEKPETFEIINHPTSNNDHNSLENIGFSENEGSMYAEESGVSANVDFQDVEEIEENYNNINNGLNDFVSDTITYDENMTIPSGLTIEELPPLTPTNTNEKTEEQDSQLDSASPQEAIETMIEKIQIATANIPSQNNAPSSAEDNNDIVTPQPDIPENNDTSNSHESFQSSENTTEGNINLINIGKNLPRIRIDDNYMDKPSRTNEKISKSSEASVVDSEKQQYQNETPSYIKHQKESVEDAAWRRHKKHIFIFSDAGKPVFTRYGNENELNTIMGFMLAVISFVFDGNDTIRTVIAGNLRFVFVLKGSIYLAAVSRSDESASELALQLEFIYAQIIYSATERVQQVLEKKKSFDVRSILGGVDPLIHSLISTISLSFSYSLKAFSCLRLPKIVRQTISEILVKNKVRGLVYSMIVAGNNIVEIVKNKSYSVHVCDLLLLLNDLQSSSHSVRNSENWKPLCLPGLSAKGWAHAYVVFIQNDVCLVMICSSVDKFQECATAKATIVESLISTHAIEAIVASMKSGGYCISEMDTPNLSSNLRHFVYKNGTQCTSPKFEMPYKSRKEQKRLCRVYKAVREKLLLCTGNNRLYMQTTNKEIAIGWKSQSTELYASFSLLTKKEKITFTVEAIKKYVKKNEEVLFIPNITSFS